MVGIIVTGHGALPSGLMSALRLLAGEPELVSVVDFPVEYSTKELKDKIKKEVDRYDGDILILTDIKGGSPYNQSVYVKAETPDKQIEVVSGINLPMFILAVLERQDKTAAELADHIVLNGREGIDRFVLAVMQQEEADDDDGI